VRGAEGGVEPEACYGARVAGPASPKKPRAARAPRASLIEVVAHELVEEVVTAVRAAGALTTGKLSRSKLTPRARAELALRLRERGLLATAREVCVPAQEQLSAALRGGARLPVKAVSRHLKGAAAKKGAKAAVEALLRSGDARVVLRTSIEVLVGAAERTLGEDELAMLVRSFGEARKTLEKLRRRRGTLGLLEEDARGLVAPLLSGPLARLLPKSPALPGLAATSGPRPAPPAEEQAPSAAAPTTLSLEELLERVRALEDPGTGLVGVHAVVASFRPACGRQAVHAALLRAERASLLELRPETSLDLLAPGEREDCLPGPRETLLSHARRRGGGESGPAKR
jgi:hypothetical protein